MDWIAAWSYSPALARTNAFLASASGDEPLKMLETVSAMEERTVFVGSSWPSFLLFGHMFRAVSVGVGVEDEDVDDAFLPLEGEKASTTMPPVRRRPSSTGCKIAILIFFAVVDVM